MIVEQRQGTVYDAGMVGLNGVISFFFLSYMVVTNTMHNSQNLLKSHLNALC